MKIVFIGGRDIHKLGGIENYMLNLCTKLTERGHEPIVWCESDRNETEWVNGFKVIHQKSIGIVALNKQWMGLKAMKRSLREFPDVKLYHFNAGGPAFFAWVIRLFGKKVIYQGHGLEWKRTKWGKIIRMFVKLNDEMVIRFYMNYGTAVSEEQSVYWHQHTGRKFVTIPTAVNLPKEKIDQSIMEKYQLKPDEYFLSLGRLVQEKNPHYIIQSFIATGIEDKKLVIAGANDSAPEYVRSLHELAKGHDNIIFTGAVYGDEKEALMQNCLCFCIPSTLEGLSITLLEAMSYGKIVIASEIPSNREGLGDNGIWVKYEDVDSLKDAMLKVYDHHDEFQEIGEKNCQRVRDHFTWDIIADHYETFLRSIPK